MAQEVMNKPSKISTLTGGSRYTQLLSRARELMTLDKMLHELIPTPLNEHCTALNVAGTTLILAADSPVWAARLRFHAPQLVKQLTSDHTVDIRAVRIRVRPADRPAPAKKHQNRPKRSPLGAAALKQAACSISDSTLKSALLRLASRHITR